MKTLFILGPAGGNWLTVEGHINQVFIDEHNYCASPLVTFNGIMPEETPYSTYVYVRYTILDYSIFAPRGTEYTKVISELINSYPINR